MKNETLFLLLIICPMVLSFTYKVEQVKEWENWKEFYGKEYSSPAEENLRMKIYMENKVKLSRHNHLATQGYHNVQQRMNKFGDMLPHEVISQMNGFKKSLRNQTRPRLAATFIPPASLKWLPSEIDWREYGAVTPVKNQGNCGSCYAFAASGALEGMEYRKTGKLVSLSEQQLVDCSGIGYDNNGCNGGTMDACFEYIRDNYGIATEQSYPYIAKDGICHYKPNQKGANDVGFVDIPSGYEFSLQYAVATQGPVAVAIDASHSSFHFYSSGIYREWRCSQTRLDHAVLVVGYGEERMQTWPWSQGGKFWIVKNSWGTDWGDGGYIKMARDNGNMCGIATMASFPLV